MTPGAVYFPHGGCVKGKRRAWRWFVGCVVGLVLAVVLLGALALTYASWLPHVARPIAKRYGMTFGEYERIEDGRFVLTDVVRTNQNFDVKISRLEAFLPHIWRSKLDTTNQADTFLAVNGWRIEIHDLPGKNDGDTGSPGPDRSVYEIWKKAEEAIAKVRQWLPKATFLNGIIEHRRKEYPLSMITWDRGDLEASGVWPISAVPIDIKARLTGQLPYQLSYAMHPLDFRLRLRVMETNGLLNAQLATFYKENRADVAANFGREGTLPLTATIKAPDFKLPGELVKLEKYSEVTGSLTGAWKTNAYSLELKAHAQPWSDSGMPPGDVDLAARGDTNSVRVERAVSTIPGLQLAVSDPIELSYRGQMLSERAEIQVDAELDKIPRLKMNGAVKGTILLEKDEPFPKATFRAAGTNISGLNLEADALQLEGRLDWPVLEKFEGSARLGSNTLVAVSGSGNIETRTLGETIVKVEGPLPENLLPPDVRFQNVRLDATLSGGLTNLQHAGELELREFVAPQIQPLTVEASWKAEQFTFDELALRARAGPATIFVSGSGFAGSGQTNFVLRELNFLKGDELYLELADAGRVTLTTNAAGMELRIDPLVLTGTNRQMSISAGLVWPAMAVLDFRATNVNPSLFQPFVTRSLSGLDLEQLNLQAGWSNGPVTGTIAGRFSADVEGFERLSAEIDLELETNRVQFRRVSVLNPAAEIARIEGEFPLTVRLLEKDKLLVPAEAEIDIEAETAPNEAFWKTVSSLSKINVTNAALRLSVHGTTARPTGELRVKASGLAYARTNLDLPAVGPFEGSVVLNEQQLTIPGFSVRVEDQPFSVSGAMKLGQNFWTQRREEVLPYVLANAELHLEAPEVNLAAFSERLPEQLRPQGTVVADVTMRPGRVFAGMIQVREVETRPLPRVGVVEEIEADLALHGQQLQVENFSAVLGGETLSVGGRLDFSDESLAKNYPNLEFSIAGFNLPLARNPDVILRSDLDLVVRNGSNGVPVISGTAKLRDSFLLRDITTLVPGRVARPERRPPYFSVPQDPLDDWTLDIRVRGENFMRVRSPFFVGVVSANFHVVGNMEEPMALGEASITSGNVIFPFATLEVKQALVSLSIENPYLPHLFVVAAGRAFGFDIRMQAEGPADEPVIEFSSVPSLTSEQIVLMLTTGQIPREDFGFSPEDRASKLAFFLGKSLWTKLNPNLQGEERLTIRSGQDVTEQGRQTYEVEYKLNDHWSLVGEYNRFGDLNAGVKWRVFSR